MIKRLLAIILTLITLLAMTATIVSADPGGSSAPPIKPLRIVLPQPPSIDK
ncbi:MAG: hypothetical protein FWE33_06405 [Defluviitaleaceae bacterium]|nr:hypothetical protein [Defluviitaleaceae bacterium]